MALRQSADAAVLLVANLNIRGVGNGDVNAIRLLFSQLLLLLLRNSLLFVFLLSSLLLLREERLKLNFFGKLRCQLVWNILVVVIFSCCCFIVVIVYLSFVKLWNNGVSLSGRRLRNFLYICS